MVTDVERLQSAARTPLPGSQKAHLQTGTEPLPGATTLQYAASVCFSLSASREGSRAFFIHLLFWTSSPLVTTGLSGNLSRQHRLQGRSYCARCCPSCPVVAPHTPLPGQSLPFVSFESSRYKQTQLYSYFPHLAHEEVPNLPHTDLSVFACGALCPV